MVLTPAQKQKQYRERQKLKAAGLITAQITTPKLNLPNTGLSKFIQSSGQDSLDSAGYVHEELKSIDLRYLEDGTIPHDEIAITIGLIEKLSQGLEYLTAIVSEFRRDQIDREIAILKQEDWSDPVKRETAFARIFLLKKAREHLSKKFRLTLSTYDIPGG